LSELPAQGVVTVVNCKRRSFDVAVLRRLRRFIREWRPDVIQGSLFDGNLYSRIAALGTGVPVLNSERSNSYSHKFGQALVHWPTRHWAAAVVANTHAGRRHAMRLFGFPESRTHVVWNGVDVGRVERCIQASEVDYRRLFFGSSDILLAVVVARIAAEKDLTLALDVAEHLFERDQSWRVVLVGASSHVPQIYSQAVRTSLDAYTESVRAHHAAMKWPDRVHFAGRRDDTLAIIADANVLYSTSRREGFPNVVLEAMACGTPVVSTDYSDIQMILPNAWQVVASRSASDLADAIERARREAATLGPQQRQWVLDNATHHRLVASMLNVYRQYAAA
jgi:glycosyltransferase involved in cell wall biosynthesis